MTKLSTFGASGRAATANAHLPFDRAKAVKHDSYLRFGIKLAPRPTLETELARAVELNELELFYQPQVVLADGRLAGAEALIRWRHPERGLLAPSEFMPVVNASSMSDRIASWVIRTACRQARSWHERRHRVPIAVNLSPPQLRSDAIVHVVGDALAESGCPAQLLDLEVTEDTQIEDANVAGIFRRLRDLRVRILLDDFGTGYASFSHLKKLPIDGLKIDRSFIQELQTHPEDAAIVECMIRLGKSLGLAVIAEGIENSVVGEMLLRMGCRQAQGYYFGRPMPAAEFEQKYLCDAGMDKKSDATRLRRTAA